MIDRYDHRGRLLDEPDDYDEDDWCSHCSILLPVTREEDRRIVGYPDDFHYTEVRLYRQCVCGYRTFDEGGWYE